MKYIETYDIGWDEMFQIEVADDDPVLTKLPAGLYFVRSEPHPRFPIRPRSKAAADLERREEYRLKRRAAP